MISRPTYLPPDPSYKRPLIDIMFDYMIKNQMYEYNVGAWHTSEPHSTHWESIGKRYGQINYKKETFVIVTHSGREAGRGMDDGDPPSATIIRINND